MQNKKRVYLISLFIFLFLGYIVSFSFFESDHRRLQKDSFSASGPIREIALLYAYYEKNELYKESFEFFLKHGILDNVDYYIVINGESTVGIPNRANIRVFHRDNVGFDFGAFAYAIKKIKSLYKFYFFMNTSVKGPYFPERGSRYWPDYFIPLLSPENGTRIAGTSIYTYLPENFGSFDLTKIYNHKPPFSHIQSMFFVMDTDAFLYFHEISFFDEEEMIGKPMDYVIAMKEIGLSQLILAKGWSINCILPKYRGIDYRTLREPINPPGDPYLPGAYFGKSIQATDVIFYKVHRMSSSATSGFLQWIHHNWSFAILLLSFCIITFLSFLRNQCIKKSKTSLFSIRSA